MMYTPGLIVLLLTIASVTSKYTCTQQQLRDQREPLEQTLHRVEYCFTGTITHLSDNRRRASVEVKRVLKGDGLRYDVVTGRLTVEELRPPCRRQIKVMDTWIFMVTRDGKDNYRQDGSLLRITLNNIKHVDSLVES